jgi:hypothetical protein
MSAKMYVEGKINIIIILLRNVSVHAISLYHTERYGSGHLSLL